VNFRDLPSRKRAVEFRIDVTNLVDIAFLLIIFFTLSTSFAPSVKGGPGISVDLPKANAKEIDTDKKTSILVLTKDNLTILDGKSISQQEMETRLREISQSAKDITLIIQADKTVPHGRVVSAMDTAKGVGIARLAIATVEK
jgi:biopolymer transport protein ExbD